jgi:hypothetical protein
MNNLTGEKEIEFLCFFCFKKMLSIYCLIRLFVQEESSHSFHFTFFQLVSFFVFPH